tara:strand:+ start:540 stop:668 length:129 start_codon:yes stop_codon:yes gene_type:complete
MINYLGDAVMKVYRVDKKKPRISLTALSSETSPYLLSEDSSH